MKDFGRQGNTAFRHWFSNNSLSLFGMVLPKSWLVASVGGFTTWGAAHVNMVVAAIFFVPVIFVTIMLHLIGRCKDYNYEVDSLSCDLVIPEEMYSVPDRPCYINGNIANDLLFKCGLVVLVEDERIDG